MKLHGHCTSTEPLSEKNEYFTEREEGNQWFVEIEIKQVIYEHSRPSRMIEQKQKQKTTKKQTKK